MTTKYVQRKDNRIRLPLDERIRKGVVGILCVGALTVGLYKGCKPDYSAGIPEPAYTIENLEYKTDEFLLTETNHYLKEANRIARDEAHGLYDDDWKGVSNNLIAALNYLTELHKRDSNSKALEIANKIKIDAILQEGKKGTTINTPYGPIEITEVYKQNEIEGRIYPPLCEVELKIGNSKPFKVKTTSNDYTLEDLVNIANSQV